MEGKKISFGFMKTKKAVQPAVEEKKDFIECVEEKAIKIVGGEEEIKENTTLVIPMMPNTLVTAQRLKEIAEEVESGLNESTEGEKLLEKDNTVPENESLEQMAVRELLHDAKKEVKMETEALTVPLSGLPVIDGKKESTLEDYESVPIQDFGLAMLRGMGWTPGSEKSKYKQPQLRPKGLGLGADKVVTANQKKNSSKDKEEELTILKNSFVKITAGKHSGYYGKVVSLDEDNGRVMVDIPIKKETVSLSEFMMQAVSKSEFEKESKVINSDTYEEYKQSEKSHKSSQNNSPKYDREASSSRKYDEDRDRRDAKQENDVTKYDNGKKDSGNGRSKERDRRHNSSSSEDRSRRRKKEKKKHYRRDSSSSLSDHERRRKHKSSRQRYSSHSDDSSSNKKDRKYKSPTPKGKRDIDKKRKGKKKRRDRSRSPNYKKHRK